MGEGPFRLIPMDRETNDIGVTTTRREHPGKFWSSMSWIWSIETFAYTTKTRKHYGDEGSFPLIESRGNTREP